jgi:putative glycosyltransferase (TIGR04348 family)
MRICIVTPAPAGSLKGNRVTALRWARILRSLGHRITLATHFQSQRCDLVVALHASKSHASIVRFRTERPLAPLVLCLTGTDLYGDLHTGPQALQSMELASRLILLQPEGVAELPEHVRARSRVIYQSVPSPRNHAARRTGVFEICVMGHLRPVKDPLRTALASRLLPADSRIRVLHVGSALSDDLAEQARAEAAANPRYRWLGERPRGRALRLLGRCRLLSLTSQLEGGANVISEAVVNQVPVVSSRIAGSIGLLGADYPGYFPAGDTQELANLLYRAETDADYYNRLRTWCDHLRPLFDPARERQSWQELLRELVPADEGN